MSGKIYLIQNDDKLIEMEEKEYEQEILLQKLLVDYPNLLAGEQINDSNPRRWLLISREMDVPTKEDSMGRWSADHLFLDQDAIPTIVEVKRSSDTRIRREVIGQMLDYAANAVVYWPVEKIKSKFEANCKENDPDEVLSDFLDSDLNIDDFWSKVKTNLQAKKIRMLFVADELPKELKSVIEFLNEQMDPAEVLGIEIKQYVGQGVKTLVPSIVGQTEEAQKKKSASADRVRLDQESFFQELLESRGTEEVQIVKKIKEWAENKLPRFEFVKNPTFAVFWPCIDYNNKPYYPISINTKGQITIIFQYLKNRIPFDDEDLRLELLDKINKINGVNISVDRIAGRPNFDIIRLKDDNSMNIFINTLEWVVNNIKQP